VKLAIMALVAWIHAEAVLSAAPQKQPHLLFILADDYGPVAMRRPELTWCP